MRLKTLTALLLGGLATMAGPHAVAEPSAAYTVTPVAGGLDHPWGIAFLPDGTILVTEREGRLRIIRNGALDATPVAGVPQVLVGGQGGLFDVVLHPQFATNQTLYLTYSSGTEDANHTTVMRARFDGAALVDGQAIFQAVPDKDTVQHYGARMTFIADGTFLLTIGDGFEYREKAQALDSLLGKVVRLNDDGSVPADNPFVGREGARPEIYSYGHRNEQGIFFDAVSGRIYEQEHGPRGGDEINILAAGKNYGWPAITYGVDYSGAVITPYTELPGMEQPILYWKPSIAPSGIVVYRGALFPAWQGDILNGALAAKHVRRVDLDDSGAVVGQEELFGELGQRIRDVREAPDGSIYLLTDDENGQVLRVTPK